MLSQSSIFRTLLFLSILFSPFLCKSQEARFKALFIAKFMDYIEWPNGHNSMVIGVMESPELLKELENYASDKEHITIVAVTSARDLASINVIYTPNFESTFSQTVLKAIGQKPILVVTDQKDLVGKSADIGFYLNDSKLRFAISQRSIENKRLLPSSKLLSLGQNI